MIKKVVMIVLLVWASSNAFGNPVPTTINDFFQPGSQPNQSGNIESPSKCDNCHGGYNLTVEPAFNWRGSMMAQAARDPLFYACLAIANQDAPASGDLCIRCHSPDGWLSGRSEPTDGSALNNNDREGVQCDFCHKLVKPTAIGVNPYPDDPDYTAGTYNADQAYLGTITAIPAHSANGMYIADSDNAKRGPFVDAAATHQMFYSPLHSEATICGTCHDVSNPAFSRNPDDTYSPNDFDQQSPSFSPYDQFPIERTYSEWLMSAYNTPEGIYAPQFGGNKDTVSTCQDCHMRDISGVACNKNYGVYRDDLPFHDLTGGNTFIPTLIDAVFPGETDPAALSAGIQRATAMLQMAATLQVSAQEESGQYDLDVRVINETGHKLPSGYPEGRRIWLNVRAYNTGGVLIYESGAYNPSTAVLTHDADAKIYEIKPGIAEDVSGVTGYPVGPSFHFAVNSKIYSDNRIPPRGFTNANYEAIQSPPIAYTYVDGQYWDDTDYLIPGTTAEVIVTLYYQTTSKEYVEFLRDENVSNDYGNIFYDLWAANGKSAPVAMIADTMQLTPMSGNNAPALDPIDPQTVDENANLNFIVSATDPDGTIPVLTSGTLPSGASFTDHNDGTATFDWTPTFDQADLYLVTFYATDDSLAVDSAVVEITVNNVNRGPIIDPIGDTAIAESDTLIIPVTATDPDGTVPSLSASPIPNNGAFVDHGDGSGEFSFIPGFDQEGVYTVTFFASDGIATVSEPMNITVYNTNRPPVFDPIPDTNATEGDTLTFTVSASDPDGDIPVLTTSTLPENASFVDHGDGTGTFTWILLTGQAGTYQIWFYASDGLDITGEEVQIQITGGAAYLCGDANGDDAVNVGDVVFIISYVFKGGPAPDPLCKGDANGDAELNVGDGVYILSYVFKGGAPPVDDCCP